MTATDLRPQWKDQLKKLEEQAKVLHAKIEAADEIFSNGKPKSRRVNGLPLFPSMSKTIESIIIDHGTAPGITVDGIMGLLHQYGVQKTPKKDSVYTLAKRATKHGRVKASNVDGQAMFLRV